MLHLWSKVCANRSSKFDNNKLIDLQGEYLVNDMDLQTEVMRYDAKNIVTGLKQISNLEAKTLKTNDHTLVQNVPLKSWIKEAVLKTGMYNITGQKIINGRVQFKKGLQ